MTAFTSSIVVLNLGLWAEMVATLSGGSEVCGTPRRRWAVLFITEALGDLGERQL